MKKYLIFDLDGTLTKPREINFWNIFLRKFSEKYPEKIENARYYVKNSRIINASYILEQLEFWKKEAKDFLNEYQNEISNYSHAEFYPWVIEVINEVSQKFQLFLSTRSSDDFAKEILKKWKIADKFSKILWSSQIEKWNAHIDSLKKFTKDENFSQNSIFIWDWEWDEAIACSNEIDFIHVPYGVSQKTLEEIGKFNK